MIHAVAFLALLALGQTEVKKVPNLDDETRLVRIKADPDKYIGKSFIISGRLRIDDYYEYPFFSSEQLQIGWDQRFIRRYPTRHKPRAEPGEGNEILLTSVLRKRRFGSRILSRVSK